jgi:hypothetical protein
MGPQGEAITLALSPNSAANSHSVCRDLSTEHQLLIEAPPSPEPQLVAEIRTRKTAPTKNLRTAL